MRWWPLLAAGILTACSVAPGDHDLTISASSVGAEGEILARQLVAFERTTGIRVRIQQTPDDATQRHQLYVQWLNARIGTPDVLQLDIIWTPEFAAAGWIAPLSRFDVGDFAPETIAANRWRGRMYAVPWFVDVGMLYRRTDVVAREPATLDELLARAEGRPDDIASGFVWQGARYEGVVTVYLEILTGHGGRILDEAGRPCLSSPSGIAALEWLKRAIAGGGSPRAVVTWHEEETRFAFQNGGAVFMRNWPYAVPLLDDSAKSKVASKFAVSPMPPVRQGLPSAATLGGAQLAINRWSPRQDQARELIAFLTAPEQMIDRAKATGQYPPRLSLYGSGDLDRALGTDSSTVRKIVESAVARPSTPVYSEISELMQIELHRALTGEIEAEEALRRADHAIAAILEGAGLGEVR
ncbi:MAG: ABC transporter substrate-binding protein [Thermoanaerobaculia bacterium]